ncbi:hypothetical protein VC179_017110 [Xanthomonas sp. WHRI 8812E]|uniref:hypothetical protein n=1 Tax=Xanthomonas arboricola TaxID=56448 RepID=UPI000CEEDF86|nr:hypothetical protein [Xanthomonas arboricola]PPT26674.1 hypothetical protein XarbCFBP7614_15750 [Xanthomonas arboricola]
MVCATTQPTLPPAACDLVPYAQSLGLIRLASWYALELSTSTHAPFSTGTALSHSLLERLENAGVIRVSQSQEPGIRRALYEPLAWFYPTAWGSPQDLHARLHAILVELAARPDTRDAKVELWGALADAEIETYLTHLLRRQTLEPAGASMIMHLMTNEWAKLSLARKRYLAWYGARGAAAAFLRTGMNQEAARNAMLDEMRRRARWLTSRSTSNTLARDEYRFVPDPNWKRPVLLDVFLSMLLPEGTSYWSDVPQPNNGPPSTANQTLP